MLPELSLNVLDIAENSVVAGASLIGIYIDTDKKADTLTITIEDNGCGMSPEKLSRVTDPFYTTRTTRKVGLGLSFFKQAAEMTGGSFSITSEEGVGTTVTAVFGYSHIDRMPLGDINETLITLILCNPNIDFMFRHYEDGEGAELDTREIKAVLEDVPITEPDVISYIRTLLVEN